MSDVYTVPKSQGAKRENRFYFRAKDGGKVYSVPKLQYLSGDGSDYIEQAIADEVDEIRMTRRLLIVECPAAEQDIRRMAGDQIADLSVAWAEKSTVDMGESDGSDDS
ncbi:hypothetical protein NONI108955_10960 [Nocardia ninae]|uniref:Uncharacterized protein n=1 Tax=Nocardia ninae NBRC 108245 TaxID=1210091 RepID=A0A511MMX5_9NOCA|nr:hypothetical protein [Nocardia ninae]GEM41980.1 hypothetical protein NN4_64990 [Nocardia ninae NBRC 108245]